MSNGQIIPQQLSAVRLIALIAVLAVPFSLLVAGIFVQGIESDEAISLLMISGQATPDWPEGPFPAAVMQSFFRDRARFVPLLRDVRATDIHPPLHLLTLWSLHWFVGPNLILHRGLSLAAVVATLGVMVLIWRRDEEGISSSLVPALLLALTLPATYYAATTARGYALVSLLLSLAFLGVTLLAGRKSDGPALNAGQSLVIPGVIGLATGLAILTHYLASFAAAVVGCHALVALARRRNWRDIVVMLAAGAVPAVIACYFLFFQFGSRPNQFAGFPGFSEMGMQLFLKIFITTPVEGPPDTTLSLFRFIFFTLPVLILLILAGLVHRLFRDRDGRPVLGLALQVIVVHIMGLMVLAYLSDKTIHQARYLAVIWPFTVLVLAKSALWFTTRSSGMGPGWAVPVLLIGVQAGQVLLALTDSPGQPWRRIVQSAERAGQTSLLIVDRGFGRPVPGAIVYSAAPRTQLWIVSPDDLEQARNEALLGPFSDLHIALSFNSVTRDKVESWLSRLKATSSFAERASKIAQHRHLIRSGEE